MSGNVPSFSNLVCSFCGKSQDQVRKLIAGPTVYICDECVDLCCEIIGEDAATAVSAGRRKKIPSLRRFMELTRVKRPGEFSLAPIAFLVIGIALGWLLFRLTTGHP